MRLVYFTGLIFSLVLVKCVMRWMEPRSDPVSGQQSDFTFCGSRNILVRLDVRNFIHSYEAGFILSRTDCIVECFNPDVFRLPFIKISARERRWFTKMVYALSGIIGHWGLFLTVIWCPGCHFIVEDTGFENIYVRAKIPYY